jgi:hypothetical protein
MNLIVGQKVWVFLAPKRGIIEQTYLGDLNEESYILSNMSIRREHVYGERDKAIAEFERKAKERLDDLQKWNDRNVEEIELINRKMKEVLS